MFFFITLFLFALIRIYYQLKSPDFKKPMRELTRRSVEHEGRLSLAIGILAGIAFIVAFVLYFFFPFLFPWLQLLVPDWLRWIGVILGFISIIAFWWVHATLGREFSKILTIQAKHTLIAHGPYKRIRHPMYTAVIVYFFTWFLMTANLLFLFVWILLTIFLIARIPQEEAMLIEQFGDEYKEYMKHTGRLFPRLRKEAVTSEKS